MNMNSGPIADGNEGSGGSGGDETAQRSPGWGYCHGHNPEGRPASSLMQPHQRTEL